MNQIVPEFVAKGVVVEFLTEHVTFKPGPQITSPKFQLDIMATFGALLVHTITEERQADGIRAV